MTVAISFNGSSYNIPVTGDSSGWGDDLSNYLIDLAGNALTLGTSKIKVRVPTSSPVTVLSTDAAILSNLSSAGPVTFNLPTGITNQYYIIGDAKGDAATNNITINTSSSQTIDGASSYTINWNWGAVGLLFNGTQWSILNFYRPQFLASFPSRTSSTASTTATVNDNLVWLTYAGARTFTLPSSAPNGLVIAVGDGNTAFTNNIVVSPPSGQTIGLAATYTISSNGSITGFQYNSFDSDWKVITQGSTPQFATVRNVSGSNLQLQTDAASGKSVVIAPNASAQITVQPANAANADVVFNGTAGITLPTGAGTAQPSSPVVGTLRYNSTSLKIEQYVNGAWRSLVDETNTQTLTNKTISTASNTVVLSDTTTNIVNVSDNTKKINLSPAANTTGATLTVASNQATSQTINVPAITTTDTLATIGLGQTFTGANTFSGNNSFSGTTNTFTNSPVLNAGITIQQITTPANPSSNYNKIYTKSDNNAYILTSGGIETQIGSGTSSSVNYIGGNYNFENGTVTGWATYSNTAQSTPVNGTGGSPASTFVASSSSPLRGTYSGLFTKSAANRQGEGFSFNFAINGVDTGKTLQISFDWLASTNYAPADMGIYVYDVTNSTLITPSVANLPSGTSSQYSVAFNATTSTSYRLIFHVASTSALAYTTQIDNISISPVIRPVVSGISDWIAYTPTITGNVGTSIIGEYKRVGDLLFGKFSYTQSSTSAVLWSISLPSGLTIDTTKMALNTTTSVTSEIIGSVIFGTGAGDTGYLLASTSTSTSVIYAGGDNLSSTNTGIPQTGSVLGGTSTSVVGYFQVPIAQWSSGITLSSTSTPLQFVSNSSTTDANDTSAFTYGAGGSPLPGTLTATRTKRVQLQNSYQSIDDIELFIIPASNTAPIKVANGLIRNNAGTVIASPLTIQNTTYYGVGIQPVSGSTTQIDVVFGQYAYPSGATFAAAGTNWTSASGNWFVKDRSSIGAAELAPATEFSSGTVGGYSQWTTYTPTFSPGFGTVTGISFKYRREGDSMRIKGKFITGTVAASTPTITLPGSYVIDTTKVTGASDTTATTVCESVGQVYSPNAYNLINVLLAPGTSTSLLYFGGTIATANNSTPATNATLSFSSSSTSSFTALVPISGWN